MSFKSLTLNTSILVKGFNSKEKRFRLKFSILIKKKPRYSKMAAAIVFLDPRELETLSSLAEAFHDPSVLDIRRGVRYNLCSALSTDDHTLISSSASSQSSGSGCTPHGDSSVNSSTVTLVGSRIVQFADLDLVELLGTGSFGDVYEVTDQVSKVTMALKIIPKDRLTEEREVRSVLNEQAIMRLLADSPWHLSIEASWSDTAAFYILMPVYPIDLESLIHIHGRFPKEVYVYYMAEIILALNDLHRRGIVHRDIKAANILLDHDGHIVLADFGLAKDYGRKPTLPEFTLLPYWPLLPTDVYGTPHRHPCELTFATNERCGSVLESPPEAFREDSWGCFGFDRWGAGTVGFRMATGRYPWYADTDLETMVMIVNDPLDFLPEDEVDSETEDFFQCMLRKDPAERIRAGLEVESHPFFAGLNWVLLEERALPTPWVPDSDTSHVIFDTPDDFNAGTPFTPETDPYPEFVYTSLKLQVPGDDLSPHEVTPKDKVENIQVRTHKRQKGQTFLDKVFRTRNTLPAAAPPAEADPENWVDVDLEPPPSSEPPQEDTVVMIQANPPGQLGVFARLRVWIKDVWTPRAHRLADSDRRLDFAD